MSLVYTRFRTLVAALCCVALGALAKDADAGADVVAVAGVVAGGANLGNYRVVSGHVNKDRNALLAGAEGARLQYPGGLELWLSPGAEIERFGAQPVWFASRGKTMAQLFEVRHGNLTAYVSSVDGAPSVPAVFRTDKKLTGVCLEGELAIHVAEQASVANLKGRAEVRKGSKWRDLDPGRVLYTVAGMPEPATRDLIASPRWQSGRHLWSAVQAQPKVGGFRWHAVAGASRYDVQVLDARDERAVYEETLQTTALADGSMTLPAGSYQVRVRAADAAGFPGPWSEAYALVVLGFVARGESYLGPDGVARIGSDGTLTFSHTQGLEMTYDDAGGWISASPVVYLRREKRTLIAFRFPGDLDIVTVPAEAQALAAEIEIGPHAASWPGPAVTIAVTLKDGADGAAAARVRPHIVTRVGLKPLELDWVQQGNTWRAAVPPQSGAGPWVVRVTVLHPDGPELGREVLEVSRTGAAARKPRSVPTQLISQPAEFRAALESSRAAASAQP